MAMGWVLLSVAAVMCERRSQSRGRRRRTGLSSDVLHLCPQDWPCGRCCAVLYPQPLSALSIKNVLSVFCTQGAGDGTTHVASWNLAIQNVNL